jgi:hypothetical protein
MYPEKFVLAKKIKRSRQPIRHPSHSRREDRIQLANAEKMVLKRLTKEVKAHKDRYYLHKEIMKKIKKKTTSKGYVSPYIVNEIVSEEIKKLKNLRKKA